MRSDERRLCGGGSGSLSSGVDVGADKSLAEDGDEAALGLLAGLSASVDELVDAGGGGGRRSAVQVGEVQDIGSAADGVAGRAETNLALIEGSSKGSGGREGEDGGDGELHVDGCLGGWFFGKKKVLVEVVL